MIIHIYTWNEGRLKRNKFNSHYYAVFTITPTEVLRQLNYRKLIASIIFSCENKKGNNFTANLGNTLKLNSIFIPFLKSLKKKNSLKMLFLLCLFLLLSLDLAPLHKKPFSCYNR